MKLGAGEPPVVLEAGRNTTAASWQPVMSLLAPHTRVVAYDRAGLGGSAPAPGPPQRYCGSCAARQSPSPKCPSWY